MGTTRPFIQASGSIKNVLVAVVAGIGKRASLHRYRSLSIDLAAGRQLMTAR